MSREYRGVWVYIERRGGEIVESSLEVLGKARELSDKYGDSVVGVLLGSSGLEKLAETVIQHGADKIYLVEDPILSEYSTIPYSEALARLITMFKPNILLYPATRNGRDLAGRISAKLSLGLSANTVWLDVTNDGILLA
ncbi:MAG: electron transfer flavoprotein subunit alpha, partial [Nitrososphaerota archaeon]